MKIKELILFGFKSFPLETRIQYGTGITAIVGPNGTGKSNIIDALRWILGEQSLKKLRCSKVEDLIFTSLDEKKNLGYTEVCLIMENDGYFPQYGEEIEIKRRFYRSGDSEFYINRSQVRLMDIQDLFLNSGALSYSILEREEIENIIAGREIREMFEDAAGIALYRERREASQRKLRATEQDLLRLQDLLSEVERVVRSLRRQARRAQIFEELKNRLKKINLYLLRKRSLELDRLLLEQQDHLNQLTREERQILSEIKTRENELTGLKNEIDKIRLEHEELLSQLTETKETIASDEMAIADLKDRKEKIQRTIEINKNQINSKNAEIETLLKKIDIREKEIEKMYGEEEIVKKDFKTSENQMKELEIRIFRHRSLLEEKRKILKDMDEVRYQRMVSINQKKADQTNLNTLGQRVSEEQNNLLLAISTLDQQRQELLRKLQIQQEQEVELNKIINQKKTLLENNIGLFDTNETEIKRLETLISELKFERETLNVKLKRSPIEKIKNLFQERYHGLIFEGIKIDTGFEIAVCAALGEIINFYLVDHIGEEDILSLKDAGRIGFLLKANVENPVLRSNSLLNYVHLNDPLTPLKRYLNNFIIVSDLTSGLAASREEPDSFFVTKDGVVIHGGMVIINGPPEDIATMHHKIEQLTEQIENLNNESLFRTQERTRLETERRQIEKELDQARHDLMHLATEIAGLEVKIGEIDSQQERNHHQVAILKDEIKEIKNQLTAIENELAQSLELDEKSYETIALEIKHLEDEIIKDEDEYRRLIDATSEVRTTLARIEEKVNSLNREIAELKNQYQSSQEEVAQLEQSNLHLEEEESAIDDSLKKLVDDVNLRKSALAEKEKDYSVQNMEHKIKIQEELLSALNDLRSNLETKREDLLKARMALFETEQQLKQCLDQSQQEYGVDLKTAPIEEIENVEEKHAELVARIERLGPINPLSITEYETEKKRLDELLRQRDDVIAAKNTIEASIKELDQEAKESFNKTFQMVREEFKKVFQNFFVGGEADIYLVDETAPFESDIEIVARPMGKKLKHIGQLSGGERTLLAISLLFAFYFVRPSPFCILDEIDAPLDDSNVLRFSEFIRNLSTRTQILLITHNKVTMEYADHIYGVTMEEPGVSKIVSVKLKEVTGALGKP